MRRMWDEFRCQRSDFFRMNTSPIERKLAAIFSADFAGYSRLMGVARPARWRSFGAS